MRSTEYRDLTIRVATLKRRFLPASKKTGIYTVAEQDSLRALRMLVHAEVESYLESMAKIIADDLGRELSSARDKIRQAQIVWAERALKTGRQAQVDNNGVKSENILKMFEPLGISEYELNALSPTFLNRMSEFGKNRGDVAHQSAIRATRALNRERESKFIDEIMDYLQLFDEFLIRKRLSAFL